MLELIFAKRSSWVARWLPLLTAMGAIFFVSHQPAAELPDFGFWDVSLKKLGHFLAYALLAILALRAVWGWKRPYLIAALIVFLFSLSDEYHQTFIPGRNGTFLDVIIDIAGAMTCLIILYWRLSTPHLQRAAKTKTLSEVQ